MRSATNADRAAAYAGRGHHPRAALAQRRLFVILCSTWRAPSSIVVHNNVSQLGEKEQLEVAGDNEAVRDCLAIISNFNFNAFHQVADK